MRELARVDDRPLQPLDGWRGAPDRKRMSIRSPDGAAVFCRVPLERLVRLRFVVVVVSYFARSSVRIARPITSGRAVDGIQPVMIWSRSPSNLIKRTCSVPTRAGCQATSAL